MSKVHFVGAGPGDVELITLKGYKQLSEADVVIYAGSLVNPDLLNYCKEGAEIHDSASMHLMEIIDVMEAGVKAGKDVVRLQTGDFSIYGSIREQIEEMKKRDIEFDCTPGVSSFLGAASRAFSSRIKFKTNRPPGSMSWAHQSKISCILPPVPPTKMASKLPSSSIGASP